MPSRPALCDDPATIDADWMQRALAAGGASDYPAIRDVVVEDLGSASNAFGRLLRCHLTTDGGLAADPATVIVKLPPADRRAFRFARWMWMHERECLYYRRLARHAPIRSPALLYGDFDEATHRFVLVLEDLRDLEVPVQVAGVSAGRARLAVREIFSPRERDVLAVLVEVGEHLENKALASRLGITEEGIRYHLRNIYRKTGSSKRADAVRYAQSLGALS